MANQPVQPSSLPALTDRYSDAAIAVALLLIDDLTLHTQRVVETVVPHENAYHRSLSIDLVLPLAGAEAEERSRHLLVPFLEVSRGELLDNLDIDEKQGSGVSLLSRGEVKELCKQLITIQFWASFKPGAKGSLLKDRQDSFVKRLVDIVHKEPEDAADAVNMVLAELVADEQVKATNEKEFERLDRLCRSLATRYFLVADLEASPGQRITLKFAHDTRADESVDRRSWYSRLRFACGQRPFSFRVPVPLALRTNSYHFRMSAPDGMYVAESDFMIPRSGGGNDANVKRISLDSYEPERGSNVKKMGQNRPGIPYSHLYLRNASGLSHSHFFAVIKCLEIPPGSLGLAGLFTAAIAISMVTFGIFLPRLLKSGNLSSDVPVLFLTVPVALAIWLQPSLEGIDLQRAPLSARLGTFASGVLSFLAGLVYIIGRVMVRTGKPVYAYLWVPWAILTVSACIVATYTVRRALVSHRDYRRLLEQG